MGSLEELTGATSFGSDLCALEELVPQRGTSTTCAGYCRGQTDGGGSCEEDRRRLAHRWSTVEDDFGDDLTDQYLALDPDSIDPELFIIEHEEEDALQDADPWQLTLNRRQPKWAAPTTSLQSFAHPNRFAAVAEEGETPPPPRNPLRGFGTSSRRTPPLPPAEKPFARLDHLLASFADIGKGVPGNQEQPWY